MTPLQEFAQALRGLVKALDSAVEAEATHHRDGVRLLDITETAARLGVTRPTVQRLVAAGDLAVVRVTPTKRSRGGPAKRGGRVLFHPDDVNACISRMRRGSRQPAA